jgi:molecular chaperone DnaJ
VKTYYQILEIPETATPDDIKTAYRRLAKEHHPDKSPETNDKFRELKEAYDILKESDKRVAYDKKTTKSPARVRKGTDVHISLKVNLTEIVGEESKTIRTTRSNICPECLGTGSTKKTLIHCQKCNGTGIDLISAVVGPKRFCSSCKGYGALAETPNCVKCGGTGLLKETIQETFILNRENSEKIIIRASGNYPFGGGLPGDLIISLICENKSLFEISGKNVKGILSISPAQAVLGDVIFMNIFNDLLKLIILPGTEAGSIIEQSLESGGKALLKVQITIPKNPNTEEKELYKHLLKLQKGFL